MKPVLGVVLAGGRGLRLLPLTADRPKCLVYIEGRPMIAYALDQMLEAGIEEVAIVYPEGTGVTLSNELAIFGYWQKMEIKLIPELEPKGESAAIQLASHFMENRDSVVCMVDTIVDGPIAKDLVNEKRVHHYPVFATAPRSIDFSIISDHADIRFKPTLDVLIGWVSYTGFPGYLKKSDTIHSQKLNRKFILKRTGYDWCDAGTHEGLARAREIIRQR